MEPTATPPLARRRKVEAMEPDPKLDPCEICGKDDFKSSAGRKAHMRQGHNNPSSAQSSGAAASTDALALVKVNVEVLGDLEERLEDLEALVEERQPESPDAAIARLRPALSEWLRAHGAHPGLCADESCSPCRSARAEVAQHSVAEGREQFAGELEAAARWGQRVQLAEDLAKCHSSWVAAGRPAADEEGLSERNGRSPGRRFIRVTRS